MNFSLASEEWNQARRITSVCMGMDRGEVAKEGCSVSDGVLLATEVGVSAVEKKKSLVAHRILKVSGDTGGDVGG